MKTLFCRSILAILAVIPLYATPANACTECHSKNPKMVRMHEALEFKDCFQCHGPTAERKAQGQKDEITTEPLCVRCHKPNAVKPNVKPK